MEDSVSTLVENATEVACVSSSESAIATWALIVSIIALIVSWMAYKQNAKLNALSMFADTLSAPFKDLTEDIDNLILSCFGATDPCTFKTTYDGDKIIELEDRFSSFMSKIAYLSFVVPKSYERLNKCATRIIKHLEKMLGCGTVDENIRNMQKFTLDIKIRIFFKSYFRFVRKGL